MKRLSILLAVLLVGLLANPVQAATGPVTIGTKSLALTGTDISRGTNALVLYTPAWGTSTRTNQYGFEAAVVNDKVVTIADGVGNMAIPSNGYVLSGHGTARTWLQTNAVVGATVDVDGNTPPPPANPTSVTIGSANRALTGVDISRTSNALVLYDPAWGASTRTNQYGFEAAVVDNKVTTVQAGVGNMAIPSNGYVLSGHGTSSTWLQTNAVVGATVVLGDAPPPDPNPTEKLPDVGVQTLGQFSIVNTGGKKLLKFPGVTFNIGTGPIEVKATRSSSTSDDWVGTQTVYMSDGSKKSLPTTLKFYWAGDGHSHWHMRDFDAYQLYDPNGQKLREGEKHGFCFEDNTGYRDWRNKGTNGAPSSPVYTHTSSCGQAQPSATTITHGLSVGWGDTYPVTLPDQGIDVTGLPDGVYVVKLVADQGGWIKESNESNNSAQARVQITGNSVALLSTTGGL